MIEYKVGQVLYIYGSEMWAYMRVEEVQLDKGIVFLLMLSSNIKPIRLRLYDFKLTELRNDESVRLATPEEIILLDTLYG